MPAAFAVTAHALTAHERSHANFVYAASILTPFCESP